MSCVRPVGDDVLLTAVKNSVSIWSLDDILENIGDDISSSDWRDLISHGPVHFVDGHSRPTAGGGIRLPGDVQTDTSRTDQTRVATVNEGGGGGRILDARKSPSHTAPDGGTLTPFTTPEHGWNCDDCGRAVAAGSTVYANREEDYDLCETCFQTEPPVVIPPTQPQLVPPPPPPEPALGGDAILSHAAAPPTDLTSLAAMIEGTEISSASNKTAAAKDAKREAKAAKKAAKAAKKGHKAKSVEPAGESVGVGQQASGGSGGRILDARKSPSHTAPDGGTLTPFTTPEHGWNCDDCGRAVAAGSTVYANREEDYDLCETCFQTEPPVVIPPTQPQLVPPPPPPEPALGGDAILSHAAAPPTDLTSLAAMIEGTEISSASNKTAAAKDAKREAKAAKKAAKAAKKGHKAKSVEPAGESVGVGQQASGDDDRDEDSFANPLAVIAADRALSNVPAESATGLEMGDSPMLSPMGRGRGRRRGQPLQPGGRGRGQPSAGTPVASSPLAPGGRGRGVLQAAPPAAASPGRGRGRGQAPASLATPPSGRGRAAAGRGRGGSPSPSGRGRGVTRLTPAGSPGRGRGRGRGLGQGAAAGSPLATASPMATTAVGRGRGRGG